MLFPAPKNCCYLFQLLTNHCLTTTFLLWLLNRALVANYGIMQRKTCWLIKTLEVLFSRYKREYILILNTYQFWYIIPEITLCSFSLLFLFLFRFSSGPSLQCNIQKWLDVSLIELFCLNGLFLILSFLSLAISGVWYYISLMKCWGKKI